jgi:hypothetical protein
MPRLFVLCCLALLATASAGQAQDADREQGATSSVDLVDHPAMSYDSCKKDAYEFGAIGIYRRMFVLSCLGNDVTSAIRVSR